MRIGDGILEGAAEGSFSVRSGPRTGFVNGVDPCLNIPNHISKNDLQSDDPQKTNRKRL
jgi:hypothetical protein